MKAVSDMSRLELAAFVAAEFARRRINVVLSGGSCVSIYSAEKYVSMDLDFVNAGFTKRAAIREAMEALGFSEENRYFRHPDAGPKSDTWRFKGTLRSQVSALRA